MAKDTEDPPELDPKGQTDPPEDPKEKDQEDPPEDPKEKDSGEKDLDPEVKKAFRRRDAAVAARQKAEAELKALKEKYEPEKADPVMIANRRLVTAEARTVLAAAGLTDKEAQGKLAGYLGLDSVTVDEDGTVDSDAIQERLEALVELVGKLAKKDTAKRVPRVDTRDKGGDKPNPKDAQTQRRKAMLGYR